MTNDLSRSGEYGEFLQDLKERIRSAQIRAGLAVNRTLVLLYWQMGQEILLRQKQQGWGAKVIEQLATDLKKEFPEMKGFSRSNLLYMRAFAQAYPDEQIVQAVLGQIPWFHNVALLDKLKGLDERLWYAQKTVEQGWSRNALVHHIESGLYARRTGAITNFNETLPQAQSDLVRDILKSPYNFEFLNLAETAQEKDFERALVAHIRDFLIELGVGFSFMGSQYPLMVGGKEYRLDLLFYHVRLHCYVVIDLKVVEFEPEFSGKMAFYVAAVDDLLRTEVENPTIGIILCKSKNKATVEYALRYAQYPVGVSTYRLKDTLPESVQDCLPTIAQLEGELSAITLEAKESASSQSNRTSPIEQSPAELWQIYAQTLDPELYSENGVNQAIAIAKKALIDNHPPDTVLEILKCSPEYERLSQTQDSQTTDEWAKFTIGKIISELKKKAGRRSVGRSTNKKSKRGEPESI
jgi:predicted nuclease of restriction endonuclease-like (RecB) superfamily